MTGLRGTLLIFTAFFFANHIYLTSEPAFAAAEINVSLVWGGVTGGLESATPQRNGNFSDVGSGQAHIGMLDGVDRRETTAEDLVPLYFKADVEETVPGAMGNITGVPEPTSIALFASAGCMLIRLRPKRRRS